MLPPFNLTTYYPAPNYAYVTGEVIVALISVLGNTLVIYVYCLHKKLRVYRNYYIFALAIADLLVGLVGIPIAIVASLGLPRDFYGCLFTCSFLVLLCLVSILCLLAVSVDRFWATFNPLSYYNQMSSGIVCSILAVCVLIGSILGLLPFTWYNPHGWHGPGSACLFPFIMDYDYLAFIYFVAIILPALLMAGFYWYIYRFIIRLTRKKKERQAQQQQRTNQTDPRSVAESESEALKTERTQRKEARAGKKLSSIIVFFLLCWMPLNTMNCIKAFYDEFQVPLQLVEFTVVLSHMNSAVNPFLYAYHLKEFRIAMKNVLSSLLTTVSCGLFQQRAVQPITNTSQSHSVL